MIHINKRNVIFSSEIEEIKERINSTSVPDKSLRIPESIWTYLFGISALGDNSVFVELILTLLDVFEKLQTEYDRLEEYGKQFRKSKIDLRMWMGFVYSLWVSSKEICRMRIVE